jgi:hypothetical protein
VIKGAMQMGNSKTIYRFEIPKFNYVQFETVGVSNMKSLVRQLNNDYKNVTFSVKRIPSDTLGTYMLKDYQSGNISFTERIATILKKK